MERIVVVGNSGSGKTTLARALAEKLDLTHIELDAINHQRGWVPMPAERFLEVLRSEMAAADDRWTVCGNYLSILGGHQVERADTIVWIDLPRPLIMRRIISRTVRRAITREELWNGNREPWTNFYRWDPEKNVIRWAWTRFDVYRDRYEAAMNDGSWRHAEVHRLESAAAVADFLDSAA